MTSRPEDIAWYRELLAGAGSVASKRMFGGCGFHQDGQMFALEIEGVLYLKTDAHNRARFADAGGRPFVYAGKGREVETSYWTPPDEALDSPEAMQPWAWLAVEAAKRAAATKRGGKRAARKTTKAIKKITKQPAKRAAKPAAQPAAQPTAKRATKRTANRR